MLDRAVTYWHILWGGVNQKIRNMYWWANIVHRSESLFFFLEWFLVYSDIIDFTRIRSFNVCTFIVTDHEEYITWPQIPTHHSHEVFPEKLHVPIARVTTTAWNEFGRFRQPIKSEFVPVKIMQLKINNNIFHRKKIMSKCDTEFQFRFILNGWVYVFTNFIF